MFTNHTELIIIIQKEKYGKGMSFQNNDAEITKKKFESTQNFSSPNELSVSFNSFVFQYEVEFKKKDRLNVPLLKEMFQKYSKQKHSKNERNLTKIYILFIQIKSEQKQIYIIKNERVHDPLQQPQMT